MTRGQIKRMERRARIRENISNALTAVGIALLAMVMLAIGVVL